MLKTIINYIIYLNLVISASAGLLIAGISNIFGISNYSSYGALGFFSILCVYNSQRLYKANIQAKTPWLKWVIQHKTLIAFLSSFSGLIAAYYFFKLLNSNTTTIIILFSIVAIISFFYVVQIAGKSMRELPYLKIHLIALAWTIIMVIFPVVNENINDWDTLWVFIPAHYFYFLAVAIPFDIRDLKYDLKTQLTIPQLIGIRNAKISSILLLILTAIGIGLVFPSIFETIIFLLAILVQIFLIAFTAEKHREVYYSLFIDGVIGLLGISYLIFEIKL